MHSQTIHLHEAAERNDVVWPPLRLAAAATAATGGVPFNGKRQRRQEALAAEEKTLCMRGQHREAGIEDGAEWAVERNGTLLVGKDGIWVPWVLAMKGRNPCFPPNCPPPLPEICPSNPVETAWFIRGNKTETEERPIRTRWGETIGRDHGRSVAV